MIMMRPTFLSLSPRRRRPASTMRCEVRWSNGVNALIWGAQGAQIIQVLRSFQYRLIMFNQGHFSIVSSCLIMFNPWWLEDPRFHKKNHQIRVAIPSIFPTFCWWSLEGSAENMNISITESGAEEFSFGMWPTMDIHVHVYVYVMYMYM